MSKGYSNKIHVLLVHYEFVAVTKTSTCTVPISGGIQVKFRFFSICLIEFNGVRLVQELNAIKLPHTNFLVQLCSNIKLMELNRSIKFDYMQVQLSLIGNVRLNKTHKSHLMVRVERHLFFSPRYKLSVPRTFGRDCIYISLCYAIHLGSTPHIASITIVSAYPFTCIEVYQN